MANERHCTQGGACPGNTATWRYMRDEDGNRIRANPSQYGYPGNRKERYPGCPSSMTASTHCERLWYEKMQDDSLRRTDTMNDLLRKLVGLIEDHTDDDETDGSS